MEKKLYPLKFIPSASPRPWGGNALVARMGKHFVKCDDDGNETVIGPDVPVGESWELADMGFEDSVIKDGWLAGNTIGDIMETYLERVVGEDVYNYYGRQFPLLIKFLDIQGKLSVQVHPDDEIAAQRYDALGKAEVWYVMDAAPEAKIYMGFNREVSAGEFYERCKAGTVDEVLNVISPKKGDAIYITPGTVHAAEGGLLIAEVQESSDMTFRLYDWGREFDPGTARQMHLEEAIDLIDYRPFDACQYRKGPLWGAEASNVPCRASEPAGCGCNDDGCCCGHDDCHCHDGASHDAGCHCHGTDGHESGHCHDGEEGRIAETIVESMQFNVTKLNLTDPLHIYTEKFGSFIVYVCIEGAASVQVPSTDAAGAACMDNYELTAGETMLIPAELPDFFLVPRDRSTVLLEAVTRPVDEVDSYIDINTQAFLEDEDYEGLEDYEDDVPGAGSGAGPLGFFGAGRGQLS
ncbi:MAG: class I mannose-6-phosphate isomerase [Bacteroidales bacterium]|nr:class I mannose-6-phosphate isomerase [Bacteroidales bacterium]MDE6146450.1 class I mannose-6-phosphate isomerase [Bacteroidales bacterium]